MLEILLHKHEVLNPHIYVESCKLTYNPNAGGWVEIRGAIGLLKISSSRFMRDIVSKELGRGQQSIM